ncbi:MAG: rRNA biogenesis protein rrp36 [Chrysothrix sp. TS-e1954]|nr:MAG: rRNA biogenesis protein rrp36 [Chrysothrix sp. TS-e1954]
MDPTQKHHRARHARNRAQRTEPSNPALAQTKKRLIVGTPARPAQRSRMNKSRTQDFTVESTASLPDGGVNGHGDGSEDGPKDSLNDDSASDVESQVGDSDGDSDSDSSQHATEDSAESDKDAVDAEKALQAHLRTLPLGALAAAQDTTDRSVPATSRTASSNHRSKKQDLSGRDQPLLPPSNPLSADAEAKLQTLRTHLASLKRKRSSNPTTTTDPSTSSNHARHTSTTNPTRPSKTPTTTTKQSRSSKHAPESRPSTRAVPRYRPIVPPSISDPTRLSRDPRFSSLSGPLAPSQSIAQNYSFLTSYTTSEISALKSALASSSGSAAEKSELRTEIGRRENKLRAQRGREKEDEVRRRLRREEREKVASGKKPFYAKDGVVRGIVRREIEGEMGERERGKRERRKRKREGEREMRRRPAERRGVRG